METIYSPKHALRDAKSELYGGELVAPFECPSRMTHILDAIDKAGLGAVAPPDDMGDAIIREIHDAGYLAFLRTAWQDWKAAGNRGEAIATVWPSRSMPSAKIPDHIEGKLGYYCLASETSISAGTAEAAHAAAQVALTGAERLAQGARGVFSLCRPPGHHASRDQFGGYCFLNNAALAAQHLRASGCARVAVLDVDFHHGNGTQAIFYNRSDVVFASLHGDPMLAFPHFLGHADEHGEGEGEGFNHNYPLPEGASYEVWRAALDDALGRIRAHGAEALVVSLGVDSFEKDPISFFRLASDDYTDMGGRIAALGLPSLFVMEGGYAIAEIGTNVANVLTGFEAAA